MDVVYLIQMKTCKIIWLLYALKVLISLFSIKKGNFTVANLDWNIHPHDILKKKLIEIRLIVPTRIIRDHWWLVHDALRKIIRNRITPIIYWFLLLERAEEISSEIPKAEFSFKIFHLRTIREFKKPSLFKHH